MTRYSGYNLLIKTLVSISFCPILCLGDLMSHSRAKVSAKDITNISDITLKASFVFVLIFMSYDLCIMFSYAHLNISPG